MQAPMWHSWAGQGEEDLPTDTSSHDFGAGETLALVRWIPALFVVCAGQGLDSVRKYPSWIVFGALDNYCQRNEPRVNPNMPQTLISPLKSNVT